MAGIIMRRAKIVSNLVSQRELRDFRRDATIVVDEGDDASVETSFGCTRIARHILCVDFVAFADATGSAWGRGDPSETQSSTSEIPEIPKKWTKNVSF